LTPEPIVDCISKTLVAALATTDVREKLDIAGCEPKNAPRAQFADIVSADLRFGRTSSRTLASRRIEFRTGSLPVARRCVPSTEPGRPGARGSRHVPLEADSSV
jgi:hypothetical protein